MQGCAPCFKDPLHVETLEFNFLGHPRLREGIKAMWGYLLEQLSIFNQQQPIGAYKKLSVFFFSN